MDELVFLQIENTGKSVVISFKENNKNIYYVPFNIKDDINKKIKQKIKKEVEDVLKSTESIYASFKIISNKYEITADVDNILFYNLGINKCFNFFVIELDKNCGSLNNCISQYCYMYDDIKFKIYNNEKEIINFNFEISNNEDEVFKIWKCIRKEIDDKLSGLNFADNKNENGYLLELNVEGKQNIEYDNLQGKISIKKIIDAIMLSFCKIKEEDFIANAIKFCDTNKNEESYGLFEVDKLFTIQSNPPDDKLVGISYKFEKKDFENDKYKISVKFSSAKK